MEIREAIAGIDHVEEMVTSRAHFGVENSPLLLDRQNGKPVVVLNVIFQHSPAILITKKDGPLRPRKIFPANG